MRAAILSILLFFVLSSAMQAQNGKNKFKSPEEQVDHRTVKPSAVKVRNFEGIYVPDKKDTQLVVMTILSKDGVMYRRLSNDEDRQLDPLSGNKFIYADGSGRTLEFVFDTKGNVTHAILSRPDGVFILKKI